MALFTEDVGKKVRKHRKAKDYSTAELAERIGVSPGLINNIENANNDVFRLELLINLTNELGISLHDLLDLKPISIHQINIRKDEIAVSIDVFDTDYKDRSARIQHYLQLILRSYIDTISECGCNDEKLENVSIHILQELEFIRQFNKIPSSVPIL